MKTFADWMECVICQRFQFDDDGSHLRFLSLDCEIAVGLPRQTKQRLQYKLLRHDIHARFGDLEEEIIIINV